jgi:ribosomal protein S21
MEAPEEDHLGYESRPREDEDQMKRMVNKEKIFEDSHDHYYRPKTEYKVKGLFFGNEKKKVIKKSSNEEIKGNRIFDHSIEEQEVNTERKKWVLYFSN